MIDTLYPFIPVLNTFGPVVLKVTSAILKNLPTIVETASTIAKTIGECIDTIAKNENVLTTGETYEEFGAKALQENTRPRAEDESISDYLNYLRNEVKLDKEKMESMSSEDRLKNGVVGAGLVTEAISSKCGVEISGDFILDMYKMKMSGETLSKYIDEFSKNGINSMDSLTKYLRGELNENDSSLVHEVIKTTEKSLNPEMSNGQILLKVEDMKEALIEQNGFH